MTLHLNDPCTIGLIIAVAFLLYWLVSAILHDPFNHRRKP